MSVQQQIIIKKVHVKDCSALAQVAAGQWDTPWYIAGDVVHANRIGLGHGWYRWQPFKCNSTTCDAHGLVWADWLEKLVFIGSRSRARPAK